MEDNALDKALRKTKKELNMKIDKNEGALNDGILLVDDDEILIKSMAFVLKDHYKVITCTNSSEVVEKFKKHQDDLNMVLLDIKMDGKDGIEVYKEIKQINPAIPIIFNTAYPGEYRSLDLLQTLHPFGYIVKGSEPAILYDNIASAVAYYRLIKDKDILNKKLKDIIVDLKHLHSSSQLISTVFDKEQMYKEIVKQFLKISHAKNVLYLTYDNYEWRLTYHNMMKEQNKKNTVLKICYQFIPKIESSGVPFILENIDQYPAYKFPDFIKNIGIFPVFINNSINGIICVVNNRFDAIEHDISSYLLKTFTNYITISLKNISMKDEEVKNKELMTIGKMAATIIHDLNNPLNIIKGFIQLMKLDSLEDINESIADMLSEIDKISYMIDELIQFIKTGSTGIKVASYNLRDLITAYHKNIQQDFLKQKINIQLDLKYDGKINLDKNKFIRILQNLLNNAKNAMKNSGTITIETKKANEFVEIIISDTGIGMEEDVKRKIFEPFFSNGKKMGLGLGMYIVKQIINQHKGTIEVYSIRNKGTKFTIKLPLLMKIGKRKDK